MSIISSRHSEQGKRLLASVGTREVARTAPELVLDKVEVVGA